MHNGSRIIDFIEGLFLISAYHNHCLNCTYYKIMIIATSIPIPCVKVLLRFLSLSDWSPNTFRKSSEEIGVFSFESISNVIAAFATSYVALHIMIKAKDKSYFYKDLASIRKYYKLCVYIFSLPALYSNHNWHNRPRLR